MKSIVKFCSSLNHASTSKISQLSLSSHLIPDTLQRGLGNNEIKGGCRCLGKHFRRRKFSSNSSLRDPNNGSLQYWKVPVLFNNLIKGFEGFSNGRIPQGLGQIYWTTFRQFMQTTKKESYLRRDWLVQLWHEERKLEIFRMKRRGAGFRSKRAMFQISNSFEPLFKRWFVEGSVVKEILHDQEKPLLKQPPSSQYVAGFLEPASLEEMKIAPLLARANLLITRDIEWANLMLGFEQESKYAIVDVCYPQAPVGFIHEQSNVIYRQLLRSRRPFIAYVTDGMGNELFRVRRPIWLINSTIYAEIDGKEIGVVHRRWHLWRRIYDLYLGNKQFAVVENPGFWNWTFTLRDADGSVLAEINRDWRGIGLELFTDAGQYVIQFGHADAHSKTGAASAIQELDVSRPLTLSERAVAVALAVSLDSDYFSRHGGWGLPIIVAGE